MKEYLVNFSGSFITYHFYCDTKDEVFEKAKLFLPGHRVVAVYERIFEYVPKKSNSSSFSAKEVEE